MLNSLLFLIIVIGFIVTFASLKVEGLRYFSIVIAVVCVSACVFHFFISVEADKSFVRNLVSSDVRAKIDYYNDLKNNEELRKNVIYSIADGMENMSLTSFKAAFLESSNEEIVDLLFERIKVRGLCFTKEQLVCLVDAIVADKNSPVRKHLVPSLWVVDTVFEEINDLFKSLENLESCEKLNNYVGTFPEIFSKNDVTLSKEILEACRQIENLEGSGGNSKRLSQLNKKREELLNKLMAISINWTLHGDVVQKLNDIENGYLIANATIEGNNFKNCVLIAVETEVKVGDKISLSVKDVGEEYVETEKGYLSLRGLKEDYSSKERENYRSELDKCDEEIAKIEKSLTDEKDILRAYKTLFKACVYSLKKNIDQKVKRYEI